MQEVTFLDSNELVINMGPQHPATHGVLRVKLRLDGERVLGTECIIGYLHRGVEKIAENRTYAQFAPYVDRMDYCAAVTNGMGYVEAVEKLLGVEIPPRAQYTRMILAELQRIASHLLWLGTHALDLGAMTPVFYTFREREEILKIFEEYCGARLTTHAFRIGGLQYDLYDGFESDVRSSATISPPRSTSTNSYLPRIASGSTARATSACFRRRTRSPSGVTGPVLRGSGVKWDIRKAQPYEAYDKVEFDVPVGENGDTYDRYIVRMAEMRQSVRIIRQCVERLAPGPIFGKVGKVIKPPVGEVYHSIEAPKGELGYYVVSDGTVNPYRVRVRPPSLINLQALDKMAQGHLIADIVAIIGTLDIVLGEVDR